MGEIVHLSPKASGSQCPSGLCVDETSSSTAHSPSHVSVDFVLGHAVTQKGPSQILAIKIGAYMYPKHTE